MAEPRNSPVCNSIDRISNLPETLIHTILSFMDMAYVVRTCVLSKRWKLLWTCTPVLNFDFRMFSHAFDHNPIDGWEERCRKFMKFVDQVFILRDGSDIQRVNLICGKQKSVSFLTFFSKGILFDTPIMADSISTWVVAAVRHNVQELYLDISDVKISRFPQCLFTCTSLIKLELKLGDNSSVVVLPAFMDLPRLTFMKLDSLPSTDVNLTNKLFSKCRVLESLTIEGHLGHMDLQISSLTLKHLKIVDFTNKTSSKTKINAPNLISFVCRDYISKWYVLGNLASLVTADIDMTATKDEAEAGKLKEYAEKHRLFLSALSNAKEIRLSEWFFYLCLCADQGFAFRQNSLQFSNLRAVKLKLYLSKSIVQNLGWLLHVSPNVESLSIVTRETSRSLEYDDEDYWAGVLFSCKLDHLRSVELRGVQGRYKELKFVEIIYKNAVVLEKMVLFTSDESTTEKQRLITFGEKLLELPRASSNVTTFLV